MGSEPYAPCVPSRQRPFYQHHEEREILSYRKLHFLHKKRNKGKWTWLNSCNRAACGRGAPPTATAANTSVPARCAGMAARARIRTGSTCGPTGRTPAASAWVGSGAVSATSTATPLPSCGGSTACPLSPPAPSWVSPPSSRPRPAAAATRERPPWPTRTRYGSRAPTRSLRSCGPSRPSSCSLIARSGCTPNPITWPGSRIAASTSTRRAPTAWATTRAAAAGTATGLAQPGGCPSRARTTASPSGCGSRAAGSSRRATRPAGWCSCASVAGTRTWPRSPPTSSTCPWMARPWPPWSCIPRRRCWWWWRAASTRCSWPGCSPAGSAP